MAYCTTVKMPNGDTAIVRMSGKRPALPAPCEVCGLQRHTKLCDAMVRPFVAKARTCDKKLCDVCAITSGKHDFCPDHKDCA